MTTTFDALEASRKLKQAGIEPAHAEAIARELRGVATSTFDAGNARRNLVNIGMQPAHAEAVAEQLIAAAASRAREPPTVA